MMNTALSCSPGNHLWDILGGALLKAAARRKDLDRQYHHFTRMLEICQTCRGKYATGNFPGFGGETPVTHPH
jgi:hypothetical protein